MNKILNAVITIYVPTAKDCHEFGMALAAAAGGFTSFYTSGTWVSPEGKLVSEPVRVYRALYNIDHYKTQVNEVIAAEVQRLLATGEHSVCVEFGEAEAVLVSV